MTNANAPIIFTTNDPGTNLNSERLRITGAGNVGIATTSPAATLSVQGNALFSKDLTFDSNYIYIGSSTAASTTLVFRGAASTTIREQPCQCLFQSEHQPQPPLLTVV